MSDEYGLFTTVQAERIWKATRAFERMNPASNTPQFLLEEDPIYFRNDSGEIIPAYSIIQAIDTVDDGGKNYLIVDKPIDTSTALTDRFYFNGPREVEIDGFGIAQRGPVYRVKKGSLTLVAGMRLGPKPNEWTINKGEMFSYLGEDDVDTDIIRVDRNESLRLAIATAGVPARVGATLGSATVAAKHLTVSGSSRVIADSSQTYTAYNLAGTAVAAGAYILTLRLGDAAVVIWEECPPP